MVKPLDSYNHIPATPLPHALDLANIREIEVFCWIGHENRTISDLSNKIQHLITNTGWLWFTNVFYSPELKAIQQFLVDCREQLFLFGFAFIKVSNVHSVACWKRGKNWTREPNRYTDFAADWLRGQHLCIDWLEPGNTVEAREKLDARAKSLLILQLIGWEDIFALISWSRGTQWLQ